MGNKEVRGGEREQSRIKGSALKKNLLGVFFSHTSRDWKGLCANTVYVYEERFLLTVKEEMLDCLVMYEEVIPKI